MTANGTNTESVTTSCKIFSCGNVIAVYPMRFAGTWNMYSKEAMPQLTSAAMYHVLLPRFFKCAYHAKVIKTLEHRSRTVVFSKTGISITSRTVENKSLAVVIYFSRTRRKPTLYALLLGLALLRVEQRAKRAERFQLPPRITLLPPFPLMQ